MMFFESSTVNTELEELDKFIRSNRQHISMVGEIGLDYKFAKTPEQRAVQRNLLDVQLRLAKELQLPVNLHSRRAERDVLRIATELTASGTHSLLPLVYSQ